MKKIFLGFFATFLICFLCQVLFSPSIAAVEKLVLSSQDFNNKATIPNTHACSFLGQDKSPQLSFSKIPVGTQSLALIMFDPDAPDKNFVHWIIFNIPIGTTSLNQGILKNSELEGGIKQGINGAGEIGYMGPCPPPKETHRYVFKVFALDTVIDLKAGANSKELTKAMKGHIIGRGKLVGLYKNNE